MKIVAAGTIFDVVHKAQDDMGDLVGGLPGGVYYGKIDQISELLHQSAHIT